jgi:rhodanese-related sulfurtransferase
MSDTVNDTEVPAAEALVSAAEGKQRVADGAVLIDVRSPGGREKGGAIPGALIVDKAELDARVDDDSPEKLSEITSKDTPIVVVCGSVNGSGPVAEALIAKGFVNVVHIEGGAEAWHAA